MTTLTNAATTLTLPDDLLWPNEYAWQAVQQRARYSVTGALVVEAASKQAGREITVTGGADFGWISRSTLDTLYAWSATPGLVLTLNLRGANYSVVFNQQGVSIEAIPVWDVSDPDASDRYFVTLRFIEV